MLPTVSVWACASRPVSETRPAVKTVTARTRQVTPSPRTSHLQSIIPYTPFVVPFGHPRYAGTHEKGRRYPPERPRQRCRPYGLFSCATRSLPLLIPSASPV